MDRYDVEALATETYRRLGLDPERPADMFRIARLELGPDAIVRGTSIAGELATTFMFQGRRRISVNRKFPVPYQQHGVGHELGHVRFDALAYRGENLEELCDLYGAALMAPAPAVRAMLRAFGRDHAAIADEIVSTQTLAALRIAEVLGIPRAVVTPQRIYARGPDEFVWGTEQMLRALARRARPGVTKVRLTDDPRRVILDAELDETG